MITTWIAALIITVQRHYSNLFVLIPPKKENPAHIHISSIPFKNIAREFYGISQEQKKTKAKKKIQCSQCGIFNNPLISHQPKNMNWMKQTKWKHNDTRATRLWSVHAMGKSSWCGEILVRAQSMNVCRTKWLHPNGVQSVSVFYSKCYSSFEYRLGRKRIILTYALNRIFVIILVKYKVQCALVHEQLKNQSIQNHYKSQNRSNHKTIDDKINNQPQQQKRRHNGHLNYVIMTRKKMYLKWDSKNEKNNCRLAHYVFEFLRDFVHFNIFVWNVMKMC